MPKLSDVFFSLAGKAGVFKDDAVLKQLLASPEFQQFELPDHIANALEQRLLTVDSAVANQDVRAKLYAEALNGVDEKANLFLNDFDFDDAAKGEIKGIKNSYDRIEKIKDKVSAQYKAAKETANKTGDPNDKAAANALKGQIAELNQQMENLKRTHATEKEQLIAANLNDKKQFTIKGALAAKPLPNNGLPKHVNIKAATILLEEDMAKEDLILKFDAAGNPLLLQRKEGGEVPYYKNNKLVDFESYTDGVLAHNKFLQVSDNDPSSHNNGNANNGSQGGPGNNGFNYQQQNNNGGRKVNMQAVAELDSQLAELDQARTV